MRGPQPKTRHSTLSRIIPTKWRVPRYHPGTSFWPRDSRTKPRQRQRGRVGVLRTLGNGETTPMGAAATAWQAVGPVAMKADSANMSAHGKRKREAGAAGCVRRCAALQNCTKTRMNGSACYIYKMPNTGTAMPSALAVPNAGGPEERYLLLLSIDSAAEFRAKIPQAAPGRATVPRAARARHAHSVLPCCCCRC